MRKTFITNFSILVLLNLLVKGIWVFGIDLQVQNAVGAEQYGIYYALLNISFLLNMFLDIGITNFNTFNIAQNRQLASKHFSLIFNLKLLLGIFYLICTIILAVIIGYNLYQLGLLLILCINQFLNSFILYMRSNLSGLQLYKPYTLTSVLDRLIMISLISSILWGGFIHESFKIEWFIYAQTIAYSISALISFFLVWKNIRPFLPIFKLNFSLVILKKSLPYAVLILFMMIYNRSDGILIERLLPDGKLQAGIYAQSFRLMDAANMIAFLAAGLLFPMFSKMLKEKTRIDQLLNFSFRWMVLPALIIAVAMCYNNNEIMDFLYQEHTQTSGPIISLLMGGFVAVTISYIFGTLLTANGNLKQLNIMAFAIALLNIILNIVLIKSLNAKGAAISVFISQWSAAIIQFLIAQNLFRFNINYRLIFSIILFVIGAFILGLLIKYLEFPWFISFIITICACLVLGFLLKLFDVKEIVHLLANVKEEQMQSKI